MESQQNALLTALALVVILAVPEHLNAQFFGKKDPRFILAVNENIDWDREAETLHHDHLSFAFSVINQKKNHHELSINNLGGGDNKFFLGLGYQFKWQMLKKMVVNPYLGIYNDVNYRSENVLHSEAFPTYQVTWEGGIGPGINAHIGRINIDGSFRVPLYDGVFAHEADPTDPAVRITSWDLNGGTFKDRFALRFGVGYRF